MSDRALVGTRKGLFVYGQGARGWELENTAFLGAPVSMLLADPRDGTWHVALKHGHFGPKLHRSRDQGKSWEERPMPVYPPKPDDVDDRCPMRNTPIPWTVDMIWSLETGGPDQPGVLWLGTTPGGLFRSNNGGDSWDFIRSLWDIPERKKWMGGGYDLAGIHSIIVDPRNSQRVSAAVSCGGMWRTEDGGATWKVRSQGMRAEYAPPEFAFDPVAQDPHRVASGPAAPDEMWCQHHNGIFHTTNGGESWEEITGVKPSVFGFAVVAHPRRSGTAFFVPAVKDECRVACDGKVVVTRTSDGGKTFDVLSEGLPRANAYDLVYRHGLDIDATGDRLVMGSTSGSLWLSENGGEKWQTLNNHLPPINVARFV